MVKFCVQFGKDINMSRIGKSPIVLPKGIEASVNGSVLKIKNSAASREIDTQNRVKISVVDNSIVFERIDDSKGSSAFWGTYRALAKNVVVGLEKGFTKTLQVTGVGYRSALNGRVLTMQLGYSHPINYNIPNDIDIAVEKNGDIIIKGIDKQQVGQVAAEIRGFKPPEPYKGKGIKYSDETIIRKAGKTGK